MCDANKNSSEKGSLSDLRNGIMGKIGIPGGRQFEHGGTLCMRSIPPLRKQATFSLSTSRMQGSPAVSAMLLSLDAHSFGAIYQSHNRNIVEVAAADNPAIKRAFSQEAWTMLWKQTSRHHFGKGAVGGFGIWRCGKHEPGLHIDADFQRPAYRCRLSVRRPPYCLDGRVEERHLPHPQRKKSILTRQTPIYVRG